MRKENFVNRIKHREHSWDYTVLDKYGIMICKPDAVELGIHENIIDIVARRLHDIYNIPFPLLCADILEPSNNEHLLETIYPHQLRSLWQDCPDFAQYMDNHFSSGPMMGAVFTSNGMCEMTSLLKIIRGKRIDVVNRGSSEERRAFSRSIRGFVPVPGTDQQLATEIKGLKSGVIKYPKVLSAFTPLQQRVITRNLVHVPDTVTEFTGALSLFPESALRYLIPRMEKALRNGR